MLEKIFNKIYELSYDKGTVKFLNNKNEEVTLEKATRLVIEPQKWVISFHDDEQTFYIYVNKLDDDAIEWYKMMKKTISTYGYPYVFNVFGNIQKGRMPKKENTEEEKMKEDYLQTPKEIDDKKKLAKQIVDLIKKVDIDVLIKLFNEIKNITQDGRKVLIDCDQGIKNKIYNIAKIFYVLDPSPHKEEEDIDLYADELLRLTGKKFIRETSEYSTDDNVLEFNFLKKISERLEEENYPLLHRFLLYFMKKCKNKEEFLPSDKIRKKLVDFIAGVLGIEKPEDDVSLIESSHDNLFSDFSDVDVFEKFLKENNKDDNIREILIEDRRLIKKEKMEEKQEYEKYREYFKPLILRLVESDFEDIPMNFSLMNKKQKKIFLNIVQEEFNDDFAEKVKHYLYSFDDEENEQQKEIVLVSRPANEEKFLETLEKTYGPVVQSECKRLFIGHPLQSVHHDVLDAIRRFSEIVGERELAHEIEKYLKHVNDEAEWTPSSTVFKSDIIHYLNTKQKMEKKNTPEVFEQFVNIVDKREPFEWQNINALKAIQYLAEECKEHYLSLSLSRYISEREER